MAHCPIGAPLKAGQLNTVVLRSTVSVPSCSAESDAQVIRPEPRVGEAAEQASENVSSMAPGTSDAAEIGIFGFPEIRIFGDSEVRKSKKSELLDIRKLWIVRVCRKCGQ